jgi:hypothetical protein
MGAQQGGFGGPPQGGFGGPPPGGQPGFGGPPGGPPPGGQPGFGGPDPYAQQQGGFGGQPGGYGGQQPGYGQPMGGPPQGQAMMPAGQGGLAGAMGAFGAAAAGGGRPTKRNPVVTFLMAISGYIVIPILSTILALILPLALWAILGLILNLLYIGAYVVFCLIVGGMMKEAKAVTNDDVPGWVAFVPIYNSIKSHELVTKAKQMMNAQTPPRHIVLYIFFLPWFLAADLNDIAQ